jgi:hypothetical protein
LISTGIRISERGFHVSLGIVQRLVEDCPSVGAKLALQRLTRAT